MGVLKKNGDDKRGCPNIFGPQNVTFGNGKVKCYTVDPPKSI